MVGLKRIWSFLMICSIIIIFGYILCSSGYFGIISIPERGDKQFVSAVKPVSGDLERKIGEFLAAEVNLRQSLESDPDNDATDCSHDQTSETPGNCSEPFIFTESRDILLHSAYYDRRGKAYGSDENEYISILVLITWPVKMRYMHDLFMRAKLIDLDGAESRINFRVHFKDLWPRAERVPPYCRWKAALISVAFDSMDTPSQVTLTNGLHEPRKSSWLNVEHLPIEEIRVRESDSERDTGTRTPTLAVFLPKVYNAKDENIPHLVETISYHNASGVKAVYLYDYANVSPNYEIALKYLEDIGLLKIVPWNLPMKGYGNAELDAYPELRSENSTEDCVQEHGKNLMILDFQYRLMGDYDYLMILDIDEIIVPYKHETLLDLLTLIDSKPKWDNYAGLMFQEACYLKDKQTNFSWSPGEELHPGYLNTYRTLRSLTHLPRMVKSIIRPIRAKYVTVHRVDEVWGDFDKVAVIPSVLALKHHYRSNPKGCEDEEIKRGPPQTWFDVYHPTKKILADMTELFIVD